MKAARAQIHTVTMSQNCRIRRGSKKSQAASICGLAAAAALGSKSSSKPTWL